MSNLLREEVVRRNLGTIDIATYLRTHGWERLEHPSRDVSYWRRTVAAQRFEVLLPHHHDWSDYLDLLTASYSPPPARRSNPDAPITNASSRRRPASSTACDSARPSVAALC